jgi:hypothetical protein
MVDLATNYFLTAKQMKHNASQNQHRNRRSACLPGGTLPIDICPNGHEGRKHGLLSVLPAGRGDPS